MSKMVNDYLESYKQSINVEEITGGIIMQCLSYIRILNTYNISPLSVFHCIIIKTPRDEYVHSHQLYKKEISEPLTTIPLCFLDMLEEELYTKNNFNDFFEGKIILPFDPFKLKFLNETETRIFEDLFNIFDSKYKYSVLFLP